MSDEKLVRKKYRFLLLSPDHPEILAFARHLIDLDIPIFLGSQLVIQRKYVNFLERIIPKSLHISGWITKRKFPNIPQNSDLVLFSPLLEITARLLLKFKFPELARRTRLIQQKVFAKKGDLLISKIDFEYLVVNEDFRGFIPSNRKVIALSFHGDPDFVREKESLAWDHYPAWKPVNIESVRVLGATRNADLIVCLSEFSAEGIRKNMATNKKVVAIPIGPIQQSELEVVDYAPSVNRLLYVGRLIATKGVPTLIEVAKEMHKSFSLELCGSYNSIAKQELSKLQIHNLRWSYDLSNHDLRQKYKSSDIFIFPTYYEGFGISLLESMSFGLIPIASFNCIAAEIFPGTPFEKFLFEPNDFKAILTSLEFIRGLSKNEIIELKKAARELSLRYSFRKFAIDLLKLTETYSREI